jgi:hypothetical protein
MEKNIAAKTPLDLRPICIRRAKGPEHPTCPLSTHSRKPKTTQVVDKVQGFIPILSSDLNSSGERPEAPDMPVVDSFQEAENHPSFR